MATGAAPVVGILHLTFEGISTTAGGVGSVIRSHLTSLPLVQQVLRDQGIRLRPAFYGIAYGPARRGYSTSAASWAAHRIAELGGELGVLPNFSRGGNPGAVWGNPELGSLENWKVASAAGATAALNFGRNCDHLLAYGHDSVFALFPLYAAIQAEAAGVDLSAVYVAHATALLHEADDPNPDRLMAESLAVQVAKTEPQVWLGEISQFMRHHLVVEYGARLGTLIPAGNGVDPRDPWFRQRSAAEISQVLRRYRIPTDRPLVVTSGRPVPYKRHSVLLDAAALLGGAVHPVAHVYGPDPTLVDQARTLGAAASVVPVADRELLACLAQWERTVAVCVLSEGEPFGLIPSEVRVLARNGGGLVLAAESGGLSEQVEHGADGFLCPVGDPDGTAKVLAQVMELAVADRAAVRRAALERVLRDYAMPQQVLRTLGSRVEPVAAVLPQLRAQVDRALRQPLHGDC